MNDLVLIFADNILPILLVALSGFVLQRITKIDPRPIARVSFYIFSPALIYVILIESEVRFEGIVGMVALALIVLIGMSLIGLVISKALNLSSTLTSAFILTIVLMNSGNYGLPLNQFLFGHEGLAWASVYFVVTAIFANTAGVYIANAGKTSPKLALSKLLRVPAVYAVLLAFVARSSNFEPPLPVSQSLELLASAAIPTLLVLLGMQIAKAGWPQQRRLLSLAIIARLLISPLLAFLVGRILPLENTAYQAGIIESAMPTAVFASVLGLEFDVEPRFISGAILFTTLLSPLTLTPLIAVLT